MNRREFSRLLGGAASSWPLAARAQQGNRVRRIGVFMGSDENSPQAKATFSAFTQGLADLGWTDGRNVRIDLRYAGADINRIRTLTRELVGLQPDIIVTSSTPPTAAVQRETRTIPIVFVNQADPVTSGFATRKINDLDDGLAAVAAVVNGRLPVEAGRDRGIRPGALAASPSMLASAC